MTQFTTRILICSLLLSVSLSLNLRAQRTATKPSANEAAAQAWLKSLTKEQAKAARFKFEDGEREHWNFVPMDRKGALLKTMTPAQRDLAMKMLESTMSKVGIKQANEVRRVEEILGVIENRPDHRDPDKYYIAVFGEPGKTAWGWRFEGHHLSLNFSSVGDQLVSVPSFVGANPAKVPSGPHKGLRIMAAEEDLARALTKSLSDDQQAKAIFTDVAPKEIVTGTDRVAKLSKYEGIPTTEMTDEQQKALRGLIDVYLNKLKDSSAAPLRASIYGDEWAKVYFAWAGDLEVGKPHYYRIHGSDLLIEYDNVQNNANHIHSVVRSLSGDFGRDLLKEHHDHDHGEHGHKHD